MNNITFTPFVSVSVSRKTLADFEQAFSNLRPKIQATGNTLKIKQFGVEHKVYLSSSVKAAGYTR